MADTRDLKSLGWKRPCGFKSHLRHHFLKKVVDNHVENNKLIAQHMMTIKEKYPVKPELTFPAVYISRDTELMVMFVAEQNGMVISVGHDKMYHIGQVLASWIPCSDRESWRKFIGTLEFS
jgi:hypothetical protein